MKKKIIALALCLIMCLSLVLTSCGEPDTYSMADFTETTVEAPELGYNNVASTTIDGTVYASNKDVIVVRKSEDVEYTDAENNPAEKTVETFTVLDAKTLSTLQTITADSSSETNATPVGVAVYLNNGYLASEQYMVVKYYAEDIDVQAELYYGKAQLLASTSIPKDELGYNPVSTLYSGNSYDSHFIFDKVLYRYEKDYTNVTKVKDLEFANYSSFYGYNGDFYYINNQYVFVGEYGNKLVVHAFDASLNLVSVFEEDLTYKSTEKTATYVLSNGNVLVRVMETEDVEGLLQITNTELTSKEYVKKLISDGKYDFYADGYLVNYNDMLFVLEDNELVDIDDIAYGEFYIVPDFEIESDNTTIKVEGVENVIIGFPIVDGEILGESSIEYYGIDNELNMVAKLEPEMVLEGTNFTDLDERLENGYMVVELPWGLYLYTANYEKVGELKGSVDDYNAKYIVIGDEIYDYSLNLVYTLADDEAIRDVANDAIYITKNVEADPAVQDSVAKTETYVLYNGNKTLVFTKLATELDDYISTYAGGYVIYATVVDATAGTTTVTYKAYSTSGAELKAITYTDVANNLVAVSSSYGGLNIAHSVTTTQNEETVTTVTLYRLTYVEQTQSQGE